MLLLQLKNDKLIGALGGCVDVVPKSNNAVDKTILFVMFFFI